MENKELLASIRTAQIERATIAYQEFLAKLNEELPMIDPFFMSEAMLQVNMDILHAITDMAKDQLGEEHAAEDEKRTKMAFDEVADAMNTITRQGKYTAPNIMKGMALVMRASMEQFNDQRTGEISLFDERDSQPDTPEDIEEFIQGLIGRYDPEGGDNNGAH